MKEYYTVEELAERFNLSPQTIYTNWKKWKRKIGIKPLKIGNKAIRFSFSDIQKLENYFRSNQKPLKGQTRK